MGSAPPRSIHCTMNITAFLSEGVGDVFLWETAAASLGRAGLLAEEDASALVAGYGALSVRMGTLPEEFANILAAGPGAGMVMLTVVQ